MGRINLPKDIDKKTPYCMRCGHRRLKGNWEGGCKHSGAYFVRHLWIRDFRK